MRLDSSIKYRTANGITLAVICRFKQVVTCFLKLQCIQNLLITAVQWPSQDGFPKGTVSM